MGWLVQSFAAILWAIACHEISNFSALCLSNCKSGGSNYWHPGDDCRPKNCSSEKWPSQCEIGNYNDNLPNACAEAKSAIKRQQVQRKHQYNATIQDEVAVDESGRQCFATLTRIGLYTYSCLKEEEPTQVNEMSFKFCYHPPSCDDQPLDTAVMAEFNAKNDSRNPYYMVHQICRVFYYSSVEVQKSGFASSDKMLQHEICYDCIGIGLRSAYPEIYYYLGLTAFPSGALLNYTIVFLDESSESMRLVSAAWLSSTKIHVVFEPLIGVANYVLQVKSGDWEIKKETSAGLPSVEISDIPQTVNIATAYVTPADTPVCEGNKGCGISITLHRPIPYIINNVQQPKPVKAETGSEGPTLTILVPCVLGAIVIVIIVGVILLWRRPHVQRNYFNETPQPVTAGKYILLLGPHLSLRKCEVYQTLARKGILLKTMYEEKEHSKDPSVINDRFSVILIVCSSADSHVKKLFTTYMATIFSNRPIWGKIKIVFQGTENHAARDLLGNWVHINAPRYEEFLDTLNDSNIFYLWPEKENELIQDLENLDECLTIEGEDTSVYYNNPNDDDATGLIGQDCNGDTEPDYSYPPGSESDSDESDSDPVQADLDSDVTLFQTPVTEDSGSRLQLQGQPARMPEEYEESGDSLAICRQAAHSVLGSEHVCSGGGISSDFYQNSQAHEVSAVGHRQVSYASGAQDPYSTQNSLVHADASNVNSSGNYIHSVVNVHDTASHSGRGNHMVFLPTVPMQQQVSSSAGPATSQHISGRSPDSVAAVGHAAVQMDWPREPTQNSYYSDSGMEGTSEFRSVPQPPHIPMLHEINVQLPALLNNPGAEGMMEEAMAVGDWQEDVMDGADRRNDRRENDHLVQRRLPEINVNAGMEHYWAPNQESNDSGMHSTCSNEDNNEPGHYM